MKLPATELIEIVKIAIQTMSDPERWSLDALSLDRRGRPVAIWSKEAYIHCELGHLYKAAQSHYGYGETLTLAEITTVESVVNQIDAQIRLITGKVVDRKDIFTTMVTHACESGRENLILLLRQVESRLEGGDDMLLSPYEVGVEYAPSLEEIAGYA